VARQKRNLKHLAWLSLGLAATVAAIEVISVKVSVLDIWARKGSMFGTVATLKQGDQFVVIEHQADGWLFVAYNDKQGYVKDTALEPPKGGGFGDAFKGMNVGRADAADPSASMAARGIDQGPTFYATANNYRTDGLEEMLAARQAVVGPRFAQFTKDGNVGGAPK
jgi:SH3 domain